MTRFVLITSTWCFPLVFIYFFIITRNIFSSIVFLVFDFHWLKGSFIFLSQQNEQKEIFSLSTWKMAKSYQQNNSLINATFDNLRILSSKRKTSIFPIHTHICIHIYTHAHIKAAKSAEAIECTDCNSIEG